MVHAGLAGRVLFKDKHTAKNVHGWGGDDDSLFVGGFFDGTNIQPDNNYTNLTSFKTVHFNPLGQKVFGTDMIVNPKNKMVYAETPATKKLASSYNKLMLQDLKLQILLSKMQEKYDYKNNPKRIQKEWEGWKKWIQDDKAVQTQLKKVLDALKPALLKFK
jgi:hypothetical protein